MSNKAILISGGAKGIGRCLARHFLELNHRVFILDIDEAELAWTCDHHLAAHADRLSRGVCDLRDVDAIRDMVKRAAEWFGGRIDVLINNGGIASPKWKDNGTMEDLDTISQWRAYLDTNLTAPFAMSQACIPLMSISDIRASSPTSRRRGYETWKAADPARAKGAGPCIININSFRAQISDADQEGYAASKAGQRGLTTSMAVSASRWGIRVNSISPGRIKALHECREGDENGHSVQYTDDDVSGHITNRAGKPEDIAEAAAYLVNAGFVTGQDITVDGGVVITK